MKRQSYSLVLATLATLGMVVPPLKAAEPLVRPGAVNRALAIKDVALSEGQAFHGVVLADTGQLVAETKVSITQMGHEVASTTTDEQGRFEFQGLRGGLHVVNAGEAAALYRLWAPGTAPPHAQGGVTLVDQVTVRGQRPFRELLTSNAFVIGGIVVAAIAIPIAIHDAQRQEVWQLILLKG